MIRRAVIGIIAGLALAVTSPLAAQVEYPPEVLGEVAVSDSTVVCGAESITVTGEQWAPGEEVQIRFDGDVVATVTPNAQGSFSAQVAIPDAELGDHVLQAIQQSEVAGEVSGEATITCVAAAGAAGDGDGLAITGAAITMWMVIALGLIVAGGALVLAARRRRADAVREA